MGRRLDDFSASTIRKLKGQAGNVCSNPRCRLPTEGAAFSGNGVVVVGVAAHITAASPGGPRYDATLTPEERRHESNGLWCCANHAKQIDSDDKTFTVETLRQWKQGAIEASARAILTLQRRATPSVADELLDDENRERVGQLRLPTQDDVTSVTVRLRAAARNDVASFKRALGISAAALELNLKLRDGDNVSTFSVRGLASAIVTFNEMTVVAAPGTGKTTTLIQAIDMILEAEDGPIAVCIPLSEWSTQSAPMLDSVAARLAFGGLTPAHLKLLAIHGRLVLAMDGWNELDAEGRKRARGEIDALKRDFPLLGILISTRQQTLDVPLSGPRVEIDLLSENQQLRLARTLRGEAGESVVDHAWRTPGVRDLVAIPLYLRAVVAHAGGGRLPTTKEEVLRLFIVEHERTSGKAEALYAATQGNHQEFLAGLAVEIVGSGATALSEVRARAAIKSIGDRLIAAGQMRRAPEPVAVVDALVNYHLLVRSGSTEMSLSFQHPQFQEFYASGEVEAAMLAAASGNGEARARLRRIMLNNRDWEESILFACERSSRQDEPQVQAVAFAVREALTIDPMLAAEMIYRSSDELWARVKDYVTEFISKWHMPGRIDRAVRFMINTGRGEFARYVWPLVSSSDDQVHLHALRAGRRFRVTVLGTDAQTSVCGLSEKLREHVLSEIILNGGIAGIDFASQVAQADPSATVRTAVIESLLFRRAVRQAELVLSKSSDEVWRQLARKEFAADELVDPVTVSRLRLEHQKLVDADTNLARRLRAEVTVGQRSTDRAARVRALIESADFQTTGQDAGWELQEARQLYPQEVQSALISRLERGLPMPYRAADLLIGLEVPVESESIKKIVLEGSADKHAAVAAACLVGSDTVGRLIDSLLAIRKQLVVEPERSDKALTDESWRLSGLIATSNPESFANAVLARAAIGDTADIARLADLVARHGKDRERPVQAYQPETHAKLIAAIQHWGEILLASTSSRRYELAEVAQAIGRLAAPELMPILKRLLAEDLSRWRKAREEFTSAHAAGRHLDNDARMAWTLQYRRAFVSVGDSSAIDAMKGYLLDEGHGGFGVDAAYVMYEIWARDNRTAAQAGMSFGQQFAEVRDRRLARRLGAETPGELGRAIFDVVDDLATTDGDAAAQLHALRLAKIAFQMPYGDRAETINTLLKLPQPFSAKLDLLTSLVLAGEVISADIILAGINELLEEAKTKMWLLDENGGRIDYWLVLLPFSDRPAAVLEALRILPANLQNPWRLNRLLSALGYAPSAGAGQVLNELARQNPAFLEHYEWFGAVEKLERAASVHLILSMLSEGTLDSARGRDDYHIARHLAAAMEGDPSIRCEVYRRFPEIGLMRAKTVLERAILEAADTDGVLVLVRDAAKHGRGFGGDLYRALEKVAVDRRPSSEWSGAYELRGEPVQDLRHTLFGYVKNATVEATIAEACLIAIDEIRDEYGAPESEPRHPDIDSDLSWPQILANSSSVSCIR